MNDWISVKEKLPEESGKSYLVTVAKIWPDWLITYRDDIVEYFHDRTWNVKNTRKLLHGWIRLKLMRKTRKDESWLRF